MKRMRTLSGLLLVAALAAGCSHNRPTHVDGGILGRVVIYRNGVAFYERHAIVHDGKLTVRVPRDRVDDFLKSLTVVDPATRTPLSVTIPRREADDGSYLVMSLETGRKQARVLLTYVTEAPAWKPSYRIVVGREGKVMLEGWAVVDNTTSEDWKGVLVGVGASSALAFRYDLWSVRTIDRDLLASEEKFAIAPPTGVSPYAGAEAEELASIAPDELRGDTAPTFAGSTAQNIYSVEGVFPNPGKIRGAVSDSNGQKVPGVTVTASSRANNISASIITDEHGLYSFENLPPGAYELDYFYGESQVQRKVQVAASKVVSAYQKLPPSAGGETIAITGAAPTIDPTSTKSGVTIDKNYIKNVPVPGRSFDQVLGSAAGSSSDGISVSGSSAGESRYYVDGINTTSGGRSSKPQSQIKQGDAKLEAIAKRVLASKRDVVVEVHGRDKTQVEKRGVAVKNKLVDDGVNAARIHVVHKVGSAEPESVRVIAVAPGERQHTNPSRQIAPGDTPVGESHFMADRPITVKSGSSAMVAMLHRETTGGVVYLYDPLSERGDERFAFKAIRLDNPTDDTLEPGPMTVYGDGRFIGEGITEPVPPKAAVVVPFALDKQIVVERTGSEEDRIAKLLTVQRGVVTAEVQHRRKTELVVTSRLTAPTTVYLRHKLRPGWTAVSEPSKPMKVGDSQLYRVDLAAGETVRVALVEATPIERTFDLSSEQTLGMMKVFVDEPAATPKLKEQITALLATHRSAADLVDRIQTLREQLAEYRQRSGELHAQVVTLRAVRTGGELMQTLKSRMAELSNRMQRATIDIVDAQEKLMLARVKFQNQLADLKLTDLTKAVTAR